MKSNGSICGINKVDQIAGKDGVDKSLEEYLDSYIEKSQNMVKLCNEVKSCIGRIKDAFPNARVEYNIIASDALPYLSSRTIRIEVYNL